jgi:hypothetical protein
MSASFPTSQKTFTRQVDGVDYPKATDVNQAYDEIEAIEAALLVTLYGGWIDPKQSWTYASATTINVPSGALTKYSVGNPIMLTQTTVKYFYIVAVADTLLTISGGSDFTLVNAAISANYYSKGASPVGFPQFFNYTVTGISATNVTRYGRFCLIGRRCFVDLAVTFQGAITFTTMPTLPIAVSANYLSLNNIYAVAGSGGYGDASPAGNFTNGILPVVAASGTTVSLITNAAPSAAITAAVPITWANGDALEVHFSYEI